MNLERALGTRVSLTSKPGGFSKFPVVLSFGFVNLTVLVCWSHLSPGLGLRRSSPHFSSGNNALCIDATSSTEIFLRISGDVGIFSRDIDSPPSLLPVTSVSQAISGKMSTLSFVSVERASLPFEFLWSSHFVNLSNSFSVASESYVFICSYDDFDGVGGGTVPATIVLPLYLELEGVRPGSVTGGLVRFLSLQDITNHLTLLLCLKQKAKPY